MPTDRELLISTYEAFNARDVDAVLAVMHPDVDWPNGWEGGRVYVHQGVRDYWTRQWRVIDPTLNRSASISTRWGAPSQWFIRW